MNMGCGFGCGCGCGGGGKSKKLRKWLWRGLATAFGVGWSDYFKIPEYTELTDEDTELIMEAVEAGLARYDGEVDPRFFFRNPDILLFKAAVVFSGWLTEVIDQKATPTGGALNLSLTLSLNLNLSLTLNLIHANFPNLTRIVYPSRSSIFRSA